jgi:transposase InsO family protein
MATNGDKPGAWIVDSGATRHMSADRDFFIQFTPDYKKRVVLADNSVTTSEGIGTGVLRFCGPSGQQRSIKVTNVLYVPKLRSSLISVPVLTETGYNVEFSGDECRVCFQGETVLVAKLMSSLYVVGGSSQSSEADKLATVSGAKAFGSSNIGGQRTDVPVPAGDSAKGDVTVDCIHGWHRRLGHRDMRSIRILCDKGLADGIKLVDCSCKDECEVCLRGKFARLPFPETNSKSAKVMDLVHSDVVGPMETETPGKRKYYVTFVDDYSRYTVVYLMTTKAEVFDRFRDYVAMVQNQCGVKPKILRSDRGGEYTGRAMLDFLAKEGILQQLTTPYSPQQNGRAERKNRYLTEMARCMLYDADMPNQFWGEAVLCANYVQNRVASRSIPMTPYEMFFGRKPNLSCIRTFGQYAYVCVHKQQRLKLDEKSRKLRFIGYDDKSKGYRFVEPNSVKVVISRDARFLESVDADSVVQSTGNPDSSVQVKMPMGDLVDQPESGDSDDEYFYFSGGELEWDTTFDGDDEQSGEEATQLRRSARSNMGVPPTRLIQTMVATIGIKEPQSYKEAIEGPQKDKWIAAMNRELDSIKDNDTWELTDLPEGRKAVGSKWVFKLKGDGSEPSHFKARIVARGFSQVYGSDFTDVYAPVARNTSFRMLLSIASKRNLHVHHYDAKCAFLNATLTEDIYMKQPPGYVEAGNEQKVCRLKRSLYGLKQAARAWNATIHGEIVKLGFVQSTHDQCLYVRNKDTYLLIYVDDILVVGNDTSEMDKVLSALKQKFVMKNLGEITRYLGIDVERDENGFSLTQKKYIQTVLDGAGLGDAKISKYPLDVGYYKLDHGDLCESNEEYRRIIGQLMYISINTRPDISASVSILARKVSQPSKADLNEVKRVLRYLKGTIDLKLRLSGTGNERDLVGYVDADWAMDSADRKSNSGYLFMLNGGLICWSSRKQTTVALSTAEAEYYALCEACKEALWLRGLLIELGETLQGPTLILEDNQACLKMVEDGQITSRNKHIGTKLQFAKNLREQGDVEFQYCPSESMTADILTKPLGPERIRTLCDQICLRRH